IAGNDVTVEPRSDTAGAPEETYSFEVHAAYAHENIEKIATDLRDYILSIDEAVQEVPQKVYVAYKVAQNFVCMQIQKNKVVLYLKLNPKEVTPLPTNA